MPAVPSFTKKTVFFFCSLVFAVSILVYLFTHISIDEVLDFIARADRKAIVAFVIVSLATSLFRMWRYALLLEVSGYSPSRLALYLVVLVRNTFSDLLPARIGTLMYVFWLLRAWGVPVGVATSSFALAFIFDILALAPLVVGAVALIGSNDFIPVSGVVSAAVALVVVCAVFVKTLPALVQHTQRFFSRSTSGWSSRIEKVLSSMSEALNRTIEARVYGRVLVLSILVRAGKYCALFLFLYALLAPRGYTLENLSFPRAFLGLCASELSASLPISGIMGFGAYQGAWVLTFTMLGFPLHIAQVTSVAHHLFTQIYGYSLGLAALLILTIPRFMQESSLTPFETRQPSLIFFWQSILATVFVVMLLVTVLVK